jgi:rhodanese-related sulfurtransferase
MQQLIEFALKNWLLFAALVVILGLLIGNEIIRRVRGVKTIEPGQALPLINHQDALVLDIRDSGEYKAGHVPDARNIPLNNLEARLGELEKFKGKPIIVYCRSDVSSNGACALLKKNGFEAVYTLSGGLPAWQTANLPIRKK